MPEKPTCEELERGVTVLQAEALVCKPQVAKQGGQEWV